LSDTNLSDTNLSGAHLLGANLRGANLRGANLSGSNGLLSASQWMADNFKYKNGYIVYRAQRGEFDTPDEWRFTPGAVLIEVANHDRSTVCGCGVNFATLEWVREHYPNETIWQCRIEPRDLPGVVVPYNTEGQARCERLGLIKKID